MKLDLTTIDVLLIQHALGYYAGLEGYQRNAALAVDMKAVKERIRISEKRALNDEVTDDTENAG